MKVKYFEIAGLFGRTEPVSGTLNDDLSIITGRNGAGKTTILKLIWYIISGNVEHALLEINFSNIKIITTSYEVIVRKINSNTCEAKLKISGDERYEDIADIIEEEYDQEDGGTVMRVIGDARDLLNLRLMDFGSSVFFPTFRRIEGGFSMNNKIKRGRRATSSRSREQIDIEKALDDLSVKFSNGEHRLVASISTSDIANLVLREHSKASDLANKSQEDANRSIYEIIESFRKNKNFMNTNSTSAVEKLIDTIIQAVEMTNQVRQEAFNRINSIEGIAQSFMEHAGISLEGVHNFGNSEKAINSDFLSAGEKHLLSFISYNAVFSDCIFIIDEPEISLHVDWQRTLFKTLLNQQSSNQFIISTHSPFIYTKYPDKEINIYDRGDEIDGNRN